MTERATTAEIIDGKALAAELRAEAAERASRLRATGRAPRLDAVIAAEPDTPAHLYAVNQGKACEQVGIDYHLHTLNPACGYDELAGRVLLLNTDPDVGAIMVHLPTPEGVDAYRVQRLIDPAKDVEGVNPANIGNVVYGRSSLVPCTAWAAVRMVNTRLPDLAGKVAVVVGASNIVGKPIAVLLMRQGATVISCNVHTPDLAGLTSRADVVIVAAGVPGLLTGDMVRPGAVVVDVGTNRVEGPDGKTRTVGDVEFESVSAVASAVSPVPGGVGPVTVATLLTNVLDAFERGGRME